MRPPCPSMRDLQIAKPIPMPLGFVENKGQKIRSNKPGSSPVPEFWIETRMPPDELRRDASLKIRCPLVTELIASAPFMIKFMRTLL